MRVFLMILAHFMLYLIMGALGQWGVAHGLMGSICGLIVFKLITWLKEQ